jgi:hypothetical protein
VIEAFSAGVVGTTVPEPSSVAMLGSGLLAVAGVLRRRLHRQPAAMWPGEPGQ